MSKEIIIEGGIYKCPECGSKRVLEISQNVIEKMVDANTRKLISPSTGKSYMSNREKAIEYDLAGYK